jgi:hypothetical protein
MAAGNFRRPLFFAMLADEGLHAFVVGAAAAFGDDPVDDLIGVGDVAGFAVDTVGGVDFEFEVAGFGDGLVDGGGTKILAGVAVLDGAFCGADVEIGDVKMAGLIFFMARAGVVDVGEAIESEFAVALEARRRGMAVDVVIVLVAGFDVHRIDEAAAAGDELQAGVEESAVEAVLE